MMPGVKPPSLERHADALCSADNGSTEPGDEAVDPELLLDLIQHPFLSSSSPLEQNKIWSQDGDLLRCGLLERKWELWHEFMKEHGRLDGWLQSAERAVGSVNLAHVTYGASKEELGKFERLRREAGSQLIQLDSLTRRNRTLTRIFQGTMQARLLASARECGHRWDEVKAKLETTAGRLQRFVSEWEDFEAEREELALWLADMDARLTEIDHMAGNNCEKLRQLQSFQQSVCENSGRVNDLLQRGEELIQRCEAADAQTVERRLLELLRRCSYVYNNIARTHTRLLSMRLVFEEDWILSRASDSGCPSESVHEDGVFEKNHLDLASVPAPLRADVRPSVSPAPTQLSRPPSPPPSSPSSPTHEHLGLEWDPSVDIGRSVSHDDADSSYFSACTGLCHREETKRMSYLSSFDSRSDISADITADITNQEAALSPQEWTDRTEPALFSPGATRQEEDQWTASTPEGDLNQPMRFDGGRVTAWLRVQSSAPAENATSCSRAVQTDGDVKHGEDGLHADALNQRRLPLPAPSGSSWGLEGEAGAGYLPSPVQDEDELLCCEDEEQRLSERSSRPSSSSALLYLLLAAVLALLASLVWVASEPPCQRSSRMPRSFHLTLNYVNGPPPT
ncbi:nesprin-2 [Fundulus heteroclitus]|uniref:nesprin-2 n=1 Tax=Fundulus heteroclitus TaxID=8078 RepID=UPI00165B5764|nr:nesprin-2 [Fundulus heteroclitus]